MLAVPEQKLAYIFSTLLCNAESFECGTRVLVYSRVTNLATKVASEVKGTKLSRDTLDLGRNAAALGRCQGFEWAESLHYRMHAGVCRILFPFPQKHQ
jgi:hypothetical protein